MSNNTVLFQLCMARLTTFKIGMSICVNFHHIRYRHFESDLANWNKAKIIEFYTNTCVTNTLHHLVDQQTYQLALHSVSHLIHIDIGWNYSSGVQGYKTKFMKYWNIHQAPTWPIVSRTVQNLPRYCNCIFGESEADTCDLNVHNTYFNKQNAVTFCKYTTESGHMHLFDEGHKSSILS